MFQKNVWLLLLITFLVGSQLSAQSLAELKTKLSDLQTQQAAKKAESDAFQSNIDALKKEIDLISGWQTGISGLVGLNFGGSSNWASNANPNNAFSNLSIGANLFANKIKEKTFWRNNLNANLGWQGLDVNTEEDLGGTSFLGNRNTDVLLGSTLFGYRLNEDIALSAAGDFASSIFNFLNPGSLGLGAGITWTPQSVPNLVVVIHPATYQIAWARGEQTNTLSAVGAKLKAEYTHTFPKGIVWTSSLNSFLPYSNKDFPINQYYNKGDALLTQAGELQIQDRDQNIIPIVNGQIPVDRCPCSTKAANGGEPQLNTDGSIKTVDAGLFEYTWINSLNIANVWKGIGVGVTFGIRKAEFENSNLQTYNAVGLTYGF